MKNFGNVITAMITPFDDNGELNIAGAADLAKYLIKNGSDGLVVAGSTGEGATMTDDEKILLFDTVVKAVGKSVPVIANTGTNNTIQSIDLTQKAEQVGVTACMAVVPYYNKPTQQGCYEHFRAIAESTSLPIVIYNVPGRTASSISPETVIRLANDCSNIVAIKEASGNLVNVSMLARELPPDFMIYSGDDALTLPMLSLGATGVISVVGHLVGQELNEMIQAFKLGNIKKSKEIHLNLLPIMQKMFFITNPIPIKEAVNIIGQPAGKFRMPLQSADTSELEFIKSVLRDYQLI